MSPIPRFEKTPPVFVDMFEWKRIGPEDIPALRGLSFGDDAAARELAHRLSSRVQILELHNGLEIVSNSFVGRIDVGPLRISIRPKLPLLPLARLLGYVYSLQELSIFDETSAPTTRLGLQDLLIAMLVEEIEGITRRGLARRYSPVLENMDSPRGEIVVGKFVRQGGLSRRTGLPCRHFVRQIDWPLNQLLCTGLYAASLMTEDNELRRRVNKLISMFDDVKRKTRLEVSDIDLVERSLTRQTENYSGAVTIIRILQEMHGLDFSNALQGQRIPGFLFDMNRFFQRLLSRFFRENIGRLRIEDERSIRDVLAYAPEANPNNRKAPRPRPDFALFDQDVLRGFFDAKYRDIWSRGVTPEWLYQLSIYALSSPTQTSVLLYASMEPEARDEKVIISQPSKSVAGKIATVILRPVPLQLLSSLVDPSSRKTSFIERRELADRLLELEASGAPQILAA